MVLVGDETSTEFFESNKYFAARLGKPLVLKQLGDKNPDLRLFKKFCVAFDEQLVSTNCVRISPDLAANDILDALFEVSSGHVGRVARLLEAAAPCAAERGAATIERFDLYNAVENFAIGNGWVKENPFRITGAG